MGSLEQMMLLKKDADHKVDTKTKEGRKKIETYFTRKLGRQDSLTIEITRKNVEI